MTYDDGDISRVGERHPHMRAEQFKVLLWVDVYIDDGEGPHIVDLQLGAGRLKHVPVKLPSMS